MQETTIPAQQMIAKYTVIAHLLKGTGEQGLEVLDDIWKKIEAHHDQSPTSTLPKRVRLLEWSMKSSKIKATIFIVQKAFDDPIAAIPAEQSVIRSHC